MSTMSSLKGKQGKSSRRNLVSYYGEEGEDHSKWSSVFMKMYLKSMRKRVEFQEDTEHKLRAEELALQFMFDAVVARQKDQHTKLDAAAKKRSKPRVYVLWNRSPPRAGSPKPVPQHVPFAAAIEDRPKQKLRGGDVIAYFHPVMQRERCEGVIVTVNPPRSKEHNIAIEMEDSTLLPPSCHVKLVMRRLNKKLVEPRDKRAFFEEISAFQLDPSQNGKIQIDTKSDQLGQAYREMQNDLKDCQDDFWGDNAKRKQKDATEHVKNVKDADDMVEQSASSTLEGSMKPRAKVPGSAVLVEVCRETPPSGPGINIFSPATDNAASTSESVAANGSAVNSFKRKLDRI